ncbi:MAG: 3-dehydroquinate synthase [Defluviitaleaceae bacterium]|nr:3-dehydroquinate synthase [Defluviitaleaceae bacterium]
MRTIGVGTGETQYNIHIARDFSRLAEAFAQADLLGRKTAIICDEHVASLYLEHVRGFISQFAESCTELIICSGELAKSISTLTDIYNFLIDNGFQRDSVLISLGGSVVSDVAGFAAATYMRGIPHVIIPTTLLAQCDGSIGGKTGIDIGAYKNVVGAFAPPRLVYSNVSTLRTLPEREFASGMAEVIKHGLIKDAAYLDWLGKNFERIYHKERDTLEELVAWSCEIKAGVVQQDERERKGIREILNFGHTIGHAIEGLLGYSLTHGECVSLGMMGELKISVGTDNISGEEVSSIEELLQRFGLPTNIANAGLSPEDIYSHMLSDKKVKNNALRVVVLNKIGEAALYTPTREEVLYTLI